MGTSVYPGALDDFAEASPDYLADEDTTGRDHPARHDDLEAAMEAVQGELGTDPAGGSATVKARLDTLDTTVAGKVAASLVDAKGDLLAATANDTVTRLAVGTNGHVLTADSGESAGVKWAAGLVVPTVTEYLSGSGTYTTPANTKYLRVRMVGGGGGGSGGGDASAGNGGTGGTSTFGTSLLTCTGGGGGQKASVSAASTSGTGTISAPATGITVSGAQGSGGTQFGGTAQYTTGMSGGASGFAGGGASAANAAGSNGQRGSGGGGGGCSNATAGGGGGGAAGGYVDAYIDSPSATYAYAVGSPGTAGTAGTNAFAGGAGGVGCIVVEAFI